MSAPSYRLLETIQRAPALALGFRDAAGGLLSDGLVVRAFPRTGDGFLEPVELAANRRGVFVAHRLRGLSAWEAGPDAAGVWPAQTPRPQLVEVRDTLERFSPFVLEVDAPGTREDIPLFGAPARPVPAGQAVVRARLVTPTRRPALFAVLEVGDTDGHLLGRALTDANGEVAVVFAYPEPAAPPVESPPSPPESPPAPTAAQPLTEQSWTLLLSARYAGLAGRTTDPGKAPLPELNEVLAQPYATFAPSAAPNILAELHYGEELILSGETVITA